MQTSLLHSLLNFHPNLTYELKYFPFRCSAIVEYDGYLFMYQTILKLRCTPAIQCFLLPQAQLLGVHSWYKLSKGVQSHQMLLSVLKHCSWSSNSHKPYNFLDAERLALIRQQRADAAKKREEEKAGTSLSLSCFLHVSVWPMDIYV